MTSDQERRVSCRLQGGTFVIDLSCEDEPNVLFLDVEEAEDLLAHLQNDVIGSLVCERFGDPPVECFDVANASFSQDAAWRLLGALETVLASGPVGQGGDCYAVGGGRDRGRVNWKKDGFQGPLASAFTPEIPISTGDCDEAQEIQSGSNGLLSGCVVDAERPEIARQFPVVVIITASMYQESLLHTERWQRLRHHIWERDRGRCVLCGAPGIDSHHWSYAWGFFNLRMISLVCRECHLAWRGRQPDHLAEDNPFKKHLTRIAEIARHLGIAEG